MPEKGGPARFRYSFNLYENGPVLIGVYFRETFCWVLRIAPMNSERLRRIASRVAANPDFYVRRKDYYRWVIVPYSEEGVVQMDSAPTTDLHKTMEALEGKNAALWMDSEGDSVQTVNGDADDIGDLLQSMPEAEQNASPP